MDGDFSISTRRVKVVLFFLLLLIFSLACSGTSVAPTAADAAVTEAGSDAAITPDATATIPEPSATPKPTETARPLPPRPEGIDEKWKLLMYDPFDGTGRAFPDGNWNLPNGTFTLSTKDGKSVWHVATLDDYFGIGLQSTAASVGDFYASVVVRQTLGPATCKYGMIFREGEERGYSFEVQERARTFGFQMSSSSADNRVFNLDTFSSAIQPEGPNVLAVKAEWETLTLFINGTQVAAVEDDGSHAGTVGLHIFVQQKGVEAEFEFDDFQIYGP